MSTEPTETKTEVNMNAEPAAKNGLSITIKAGREDNGNPVFFFVGRFRGEDFSGTANDMSTAWSMAVECVELISYD